MRKSLEVAEIVAALIGMFNLLMALGTAYCFLSNVFGGAIGTGDLASWYLGLPRSILIIGAAASIYFGFWLYREIKKFKKDQQNRKNVQKLIND